MTKRERIYNKFGGLCAYSGTPLEADWQIEHINPVVRNCFSKGMMFKDSDNEENMVPVQKLINHYKHSMTLEEFRRWYLGGMHNRLKKLPKNPISDKNIKRKAYMLKIAAYFGITENNPFSGVFYFETITSEQKSK
jgi:hypothetical protein